MKFKKVGIEICGYEIYVDADCKKISTIQQKIIDGHKSLKAKKQKDSVPNDFKPLIRW